MTDDNSSIFFCNIAIKSFLNDDDRLRVTFFSQLSKYC